MWLAPRAAPLQTSAILPMFPRVEQVGEGFQTDASRLSFPCEAGEGAEGGWGQSWLQAHKLLRIKRYIPLVRVMRAWNAA